MAKKIKMKTEKHAVVPAKKAEVVTPEVVNPVVMPDDKNLAAQITEDINNAELGAFCRVRAGVGLCNIRELNAHGAWEERMLSLFPNRSRRTLFRYMQDGRKFCAAVDMDAQHVYEKMMAVDVKRLHQMAALPADARKALPVRGVAREVGAGLVVVVDALAACRCDHLYATVQICDRGLQPGSGVRAGVRRVAIDAVNVGCPVISMGIPTAIDSATLICDALFRAGICGVGDALSHHLAQSCGYVVAPVQADLLVARGGALLAEAIGECFGQGGGHNQARRHI